jgi:RHS repeat-associated protein
MKRASSVLVLATFGLQSTALAQNLPGPSVTREHIYPTGWSLVSVPLQPADPAPASVFTQALLRIYDYVGGQTLGVGETGFRDVVPGRPLWMLVGAPVTVSVTGTLVGGSEHRLPLVPGWNAVATPWTAPVAWSDERVSVRSGTEQLPLSQAISRGWLRGSLSNPVSPDGTEVSLEPNASPAAQLVPWQGYLLLSEIAGDLVFAAPPPDTQAPTVGFQAPGDGAEVATLTDVVGTVDDPNLASWRLEFATDSTGTFSLLASGTGPITQGALTRLDPTLLENGLFTLRLAATDFAGNTASIERTVFIAGQHNKLGAFRLVFKDLEVPVSGIPIAIQRVYDTRRRAIRGDFGFGWTVEVGARGRYYSNRKPGDGWRFTSGFLPCQSVQEVRPHVTEVRFTDREFYRFALQVTGGPILGGCLGTARFVQTDGLPGATLEILGDGEVLWENGTTVLRDPATFDVFEPQNVRLTTQGGRQFDLNLRSGVTRVADPTGNAITIGPAGVVHSSGKSVAFQRDALGRITAITDPLGQVRSYEYDAAGDLEVVRDPAGGEVQHEYLAGHYLSKITDPLGQVPVRTEYDEDGRLVAVVDALGNRSEVINDVAGNASTTVDRMGNATQYRYDADGNLTEKVDAAGGITRYTYDARGNLLTEQDALGRVTAHTYDATDNVLSETDGMGQVTRYTYDADGHLLTSTDPRGKVVTITYDANGSPLTSRDALGNELTFTYDSRGLATLQKDALGCETRYQYDAAGNMTVETDSMGVATQYTYDANGNVLTRTTPRTRPDGATEAVLTTYAYDWAGRLTTQTDPDGGVTRHQYNAAGQHVSTVDRLGRETRFEYDELGALREVTFPDGTTEENTYDLEGRRSELKDRAGRVTRFSYDRLGHLSKTTYPDGAVELEEHDAAGQLISQTDARGNVTRFTYDAGGQQTRVKDALGQDTVYTYDVNANRLSEKDARGATVTYEYDALNRQVRTVYPDGTDMKTAYDAGGRPTSETDQGGRVTRFTHDCRGRLTTVTDALNQVTRYAYDEQGNRVSQTDASGRVTRFEYDRMGRLERSVLPGGDAEILELDAGGNVLVRTDPRGQVTRVTYDPMDRVLERAYPDGSRVAYTYGPTGEPITMEDARGVTRMERDLRDRVTRITYPDGRKLEYAYDLAGNRTRLTAVVGASTLPTSYEYDALNQLTLVTDPLGRAYRQSFDANGNRATITQPNGVATALQHDAQNRLTRLSANAGASTLHSYTYTLAPTGKRTAVAEADGTQRSYGYDALDRLTRETVGGLNPAPYDKTLAYDAVGNRLSQVTTGSGAGALSYTYDARDRLLTEGAAALSWDENGNLTARAGDASYTWDFDDRLRRVQKADGTVVTHAYDADGNRVRTEVTPATGPPAIVTNFLVDPTCTSCQVVAESDGAGNLAAYYVRGDDLLAVVRGSGSRFYHPDALGSARRLTDDSGALTDAYSYTAFGELLDHAGSDPNRYLFAGEALDRASGLYDNRARWMDPRVGRFVSSDPFPGDHYDPQSLHRYAYARLDPVNNVDPSGLTTLAGQMTTTQMMGTLNTAARPVYRSFLKKAAHLVVCKASVATLKKGLGPQGHHPLPKFVGGNQKQTLIYLNPDMHRSFHQVLDLILRYNGLLPGLGGPAGSTQAWSAFMKAAPGTQFMAFAAVLAAAKVIDNKCKLKGRDSLAYAVRQSFKNGDFQRIFD